MNQGNLESNPVDGKFTLVLVEGYSYTVEINAEGYSPKELVFDLTNIFDYQLLLENVSLEKIFKTVRIVTKNKVTRKSIEATIVIVDEADIPINHDSTGNYSIPMSYGENHTLRFSRLGFKDVQKTISLNRETLDSMLTEIWMVPGTPKLVLTVKDEETEEIIPGARLEFRRGRAQPLFRGPIRGEKYETELEYNRYYQIKLKAKGYFYYQDTINLQGIYDGRLIEKEILMTPLKVGNKLTLSDIYFEVNSAALTEKSKAALGDIASLLRQNRNLTVEVGAYTDDVGEEDYNMSLSGKRANSVRDYLISKDISERALVAKGYGETNPVVLNDSVENRALNRRVEFKILRVR